MPKRLLIVRFSSFGDIVQAIGVPLAFRSHFDGAEVDWVTRADFAGLLHGHPEIRSVVSFAREDGFLGLIRLAWKLAASGQYTHLYDAHNNLRSQFFCAVFRLRAPFTHFLRRPKDRLRRWLFFRWRLPVFERPFRGANSFHKPLTPWGLESRVPRGPQFYPSQDLPAEIREAIGRLPRPLLALAPSAAWEMKRWPDEHWKEFVRLMPRAGFVFLGGPKDTFINEIARVASAGSALNLAGHLTLEQNAAVFDRADLVVAGDTGLLHVADQMERLTVALIGPTAFGYPSHATSTTVEMTLDCKPCSKDGRGKCINSLYKRCLVEITPQRLVAEVEKKL